MIEGAAFGFGVVVGSAVGAAVLYVAWCCTRYAATNQRDFC